MSLRMRKVHFLPRTPKLVLMGQFLKATVGRMGSSACLPFKITHYTFGLYTIYLVCFV